MPTERLPMRQVREILRLTFEGGLPSREAARRVPVASWHHAIGDATYADAILDRLVHNV